MQIAGTVTGTDQAGDPVVLEFTLYGAGGEAIRGTITVQRPPPDAPGQFSLSLPVTEPVIGRYSVR